MPSSSSTKPNRIGTPNTEIIQDNNAEKSKERKKKKIKSHEQPGHTAPAKRPLRRAQEDFSNETKLDPVKKKKGRSKTRPNTSSSRTTSHSISASPEQTKPKKRKTHPPTSPPPIEQLREQNHTTATAKSVHHEQDDETRRKRRKFVLLFVVFVLLFILILGLALGLKGSDDENKNSNVSSPSTMSQSPITPPVAVPSNDPFWQVVPTTENPTRASAPSFSATPGPVMPITPSPTTMAPLASPIDSGQVRILTADQDTYIYSDGFFQYEAYGTEDSLLVQNGLAEFYEIADAFSLISFDTTGLTPTPRQAILQVSHVASSEVRSQASTITVYRRPSVRGRIETFHGGYTLPQVEGQVPGPSFTVSYNDNSDIRIDVTSLLSQGDGFPTTQMLFMLFNGGSEHEAGDRFHSRESSRPPKLELTF
jgi:hypothetical protein